MPPWVWGALNVGMSGKVDLVKSPSPVTPFEDCLIQVAEDARALRTATDALRRRVACGPDEAFVLDQMAAMLRASAKARPGTPGFALEVEREAFLRQFGRVVLDQRSGPDDASLVLMGGALAHVMAMIVALVPMLRDGGMEVLVADMGADPRTRLLPLHIAELRVIGGEDAASACNLAVSAARGRNVAVLGGIPASTKLAPPAGQAWVGGTGSQSLARWGIRLPASPVAQPGVLIATSRASWQAVGGLDAEMDDGDGLAIADLVLRLHRAGTLVMSCDAFEAQPRGPLDPSRQWRCVQRFRTIWGDRPDAGFGFI